MEENKIYQNDNPKNGPLDGVQLRTDCVRTKFTQKRQKTGYPFKQSQTKANVSASVETGTFSIRDVQPQRMRAERRKDVRKRRKMQELRSQNPIYKDEVGKVHACE